MFMIKKISLKFVGSTMDIDKVLSDLSPTFADFLKTINSSAPALFSALEKITPNPSMVHVILEI